MRSKGGKWVTSSPKNRIVPEVGGKSPVMQLNSVVFPAPLEPSTARRSPGRTVSVTSVSAASAPNNRVTPRNSSAAPAPTVERRCATLSMAVISARPWRRRQAPPAFPKSDDAVRREQHDDKKTQADQQAEAIAVEPDRNQKIQCEGAQQHENQGADEWADRARDPADDGDDQNVDRPLDSDRTRRDLAIVPDLQDTGERGQERGERIGRDAVRVDVEPKRHHAARIVAHALQGQAERRARQIADRAEAEHRDREYQIIKRDIRAPVEAPKMWRDD